MHELDEDRPASAMHGVRHAPPAFDMGVLVKARREQISARHRAWRGSLGDDQSRRGALPVIFHVQFGRNVRKRGAIAATRKYGVRWSESQRRNEPNRKDPGANRDLRAPRYRKVAPTPQIGR